MSEVEGRKWKYTLGELGELSKAGREEFYKTRVWFSTPDDSAAQIPRVKFLMTWHSLEQYTRVLDICAGDGFGTRWLADESSIKEVIGVDLCAKAIQYAEDYRKGRANPDKLRYILGSWEDIPTLELGKFDAVVCFEAVEHFPEAEGRKLIALMHEMLVPGGRAFISTPERFGVFGEQNVREREHVKLYTEADLRREILSVTGSVPDITLSAGDLLEATWTKDVT